MNEMGLSSQLRVGRRNDAMARIDSSYLRDKRIDGPVNQESTEGRILNVHEDGMHFLLSFKCGIPK